MKYFFVLMCFFCGIALHAQDNSPGPAAFRLMEKNNSFSLNRILNIVDKQQNVSVGGLFIAPYFGFVFPMRSFNENSNTGIVYGGKLEFAHSKIYPFVIGAFFEQQKHKGSEEYKALYRLATFQTNITSVGGGVDIVLNKYIKSNFTIPFISLEGRYMNVTRIIEPPVNNPGVLASESLIGYTAGLGFTLYIFDLYGKYTFAKEFSNLSINIRVRYPIVKF